MSRRLLVSRAPGPIRRHFATEPVVDYYAVLGVPPGATTKVSLAYEVLGSDEKRKMYDMTRIRTSPDLGYVGCRTS
ncbi:DnaJ domain protein [Cooperia oncophora]